MEGDEFSDTMEFIKMETEEPSGPLLSSCEIIKKIENGQFNLRDSYKRSKVWTVYARIHNQIGELIHGYVYCRECGKLLAFNNSTSNLIKHKCYILKCTNKMDAQKTENLNSPSESNVQPSTIECRVDVFNSDYANNILTGLFTKCFIKSCRSYEILQDDDFKAIFQELIAFGAKFGTNIDTNKIIPDSTAIAKNVNDIYKNCFSRVSREIAAAKEHGIGLACHLWANDFAKKSYFVLTAHFFKAGKFASRLLELGTIEDEKCSNQNIAQHIHNVLKEYNYDLSSTSLIVASGCTDVIGAQTVPCISTALSDALVKSMNEIPEISQLITSCLKCRRFLINNQREMKQEKHPSVNHWLSIYKVLELMLNSWTDIEKTINSKSEAQMANINSHHLEEIVKTLRPFKDALESLEDEDSATLHLVLVYMHNLSKFCEAKDNECEPYNFIRSVKKLLGQHLERIVAENVTIFHKVALFLYPPANKLLLFDQTEKKNIEAECVRLMQHFKVEVKDSSKQEPEDACAGHSKRRKLFSDFVCTDTDKDTSELIAEELQIYKLTRVKDSEDFDVFNWWQQQQQHFPRLYKLSHIVLSTPATSAAAQRICASSGDLLRDKMPEFGTNPNETKNIAFVKFNTEPDELDLKA